MLYTVPYNTVYRGGGGGGGGGELGLEKLGSLGGRKLPPAPSPPLDRTIIHTLGKVYLFVPYRVLLRLLLMDG